MQEATHHSDPIRIVDSKGSIEDKYLPDSIKLSPLAPLAMNTVPLVLKHFLDVLHDNFSGKQFEYRIEEKGSVPDKILKLWRSRGFEPAETGIALVTFEQGRAASKEYSCPLYFWNII